MVQIVIMVLDMHLITFSLFGDNPLYCVGAVENARLAKEIYPDWTARFYVAQDVPSTYITAIKEYGAEIVHCEMNNSYDGLNWRFRPLNEPDVDYWISRDADSRLSWRERNAVDEWLDSDKSAHLLRDCHNHGYTIMAGMFGINNKLFHSRYGSLNLDNDNANLRDADQTLLNDKLWPLIKHDHLCHDHWRNSKIVGQPTYQPGDHVHYKNAYQVGLIDYIEYQCYQQLSEIYPEGQDNRPFPLHKPMEYGIFVGQIIGVDGKPKINTDVRWEYELRGLSYE
jgi:hypothetical protein